MSEGESRTLSIIRRFVGRVWLRLGGRKVEPSSSEVSGEVPRAPVEGDVDLVVREAFFQDSMYRGTIIEVGAAKPDYLSISASFRQLGWRVLAVEPNPSFCALYRKRGIDVIECACGEVDAENVPFFVIHTTGQYLGETVTNESFSSLGIRGKFAELMETVSSSQEEIKVRVRRLDSILRERKIVAAEIDILSVDVEGWELEVLAGLSTEHLGPKIMIIENVFSDKEYLDIVTSRGYHLWKRIEPNDIFVRNDIFPAS